MHPRFINQDSRTESIQRTTATVFHSYFLSLGGRIAQPIMSEQDPGKYTCAEVGNSGEPRRALGRRQTLGAGQCKEKPVTSAFPTGPRVLAMEPGSFLSTRLEALLLMGSKLRLLPEMNF